VSRASRLACVATLLVVVAGLSCGGDATAPLVPTTLRLDTQSVTLDAIGATQPIAATVLDQNGVVIPRPAITATATVTVLQVAVAPLKVSGDLQSGTPGSALPQSVTVKIADRLGNAMAGKSVTFAVTQGGGNAATPNATSAADGTASTNWTIGTNASVTNQVTATVIGVSAVTTFTATTLAGPAVGITFGGGLPTVDLGAVAPVNAAVRDRFGNAIAGATVALTSRNPTILSVSPAGTMTGIGRGQTVIVATTTTGTAFTDSTIAVVRVPGGPMLVSSLTSFSLAHDTTVTVSVLVNVGAGAARVGSSVIFVSWDPAVLHFVSSAAGAAGGAIINSANAGTGSLVLAFADASGFFGNAELARITFQVASSVGATGPLALGAVELSGIDFADLFGNLVQVVQPVVIR
jgi:hypothetical protein